MHQALTAVASAEGTATDPRVQDELKDMLERELEAKARDRDRREDADGASMFPDGSPQ